MNPSSTRAAPPSPIAALYAPCAAAMRHNLGPGLVLQAFALAIVAAYFTSPGFRSLLDRIGEVKVQFGYLYSALATAMAGGLIPYLVLLGSGRLPAGGRGRELAFHLLFWVWKGVEVDLLYRGQAALFGTVPTVAVVAAKTALDQFVYGPLWSAPTQMFLYLWKDAGFSGATLRARLATRSALHRTAIILFSAWVVWIPAVAIIYSLPTALQIPLFNLVLCFWALLLTFLARDGD